ncbi:MAG: ATP-binding protein [Candidatus Binatia bacterium]
MIDTVSVREREVRDHEGRWYSLRVRPYKTLENKIDGAVLVLVDVDRLKRAREYAESIVTTMREPFLVLDQSLRVMTASRSFCKDFGVTPEETEGRLLYDLGNGQWNIAELRRLLEEVLPRASSFDDFVVEQDFEHVGRRTMLLNARSLIREAGQSPLILLAIEDVSVGKRLEVLQKRVMELTEAERSRNQFLAMLAHELRNPLAPLRNAARILRSPEADVARAQRAREIIDRQIENMARMIDDLLDVSRITQGKIRLRKDPVELVAVLSRAVESSRDDIDARGQDLVVSLPREPVYVEADAARLEQIFANLLNNAAKFSDRGGHIWLTVETADGAADSSEEITVRVRDDGIGIAPQMLPRVFEVFIQADRSLERAHGGLGIGLTMVKSLVEAHGGRVEAHSRGIGQGSEFVVRLPNLRREGTGTERREGPEVAVAGSPSSPVAPVARALRVLVVDDNLDAAESLSAVLELAGHRVEAAHDGPGALETAKRFQPDVVLLDIGLPGMDGYEVARELRRLRLPAKPLLVALTGYGQDEDRRLAREAGFDQHWTKPVAPEAVEDLLARCRKSAK